MNGKAHDNLFLEWAPTQMYPIHMLMPSLEMLWPKYLGYFLKNSHWISSHIASFVLESLRWCGEAWHANQVSGCIPVYHSSLCRIWCLDGVWGSDYKVPYNSKVYRPREYIESHRPCPPIWGERCRRYGCCAGGHQESAISESCPLPLLAACISLLEEGMLLLYLYGVNLHPWRSWGGPAEEIVVIKLPSIHVVSCVLEEYEVAL